MCVGVVHRYGWKPRSRLSQARVGPRAPYAGCPLLLEFGWVKCRRQISVCCKTCVTIKTSSSSTNFSLSNTSVRSSKAIYKYIGLQHIGHVSPCSKYHVVCGIHCLFWNHTDSQTADLGLGEKLIASKGFSPTFWQQLIVGKCLSGCHRLADCFSSCKDGLWKYKDCKRFVNFVTKPGLPSL